MKHTYQIKGMTCNGCKNSVENVLESTTEIRKAVADLENNVVEIEMTAHFSVEQLQEILLKGGLHYTISMHGDTHTHQDSSPQKIENGNGVFYCPMHCEGEKTYDEPGDCPVCGMDLVE